jgi:hypothetical protein
MYRVTIETGDARNFVIRTGAAPAGFPPLVFFADTLAKALEWAHANLDRYGCSTVRIEK